MNKKLKKVGVVLLNWNLADDAIKCVYSLRKYVKSCALEIIIVDNGSEKNDANKLNILKDVVIINNKANLLFAKGCNQGIRKLMSSKNKPEYVLLINNDAYCKSDFIAPLLVGIDSSKDIGSANPIIYFSSKPNTVCSSGGVVNSKQGILSSEYYNTKKNFKLKQKPYFIDWANGCAELIKTEVFEKCGLLSEKLIMYSEDVEFSLRSARYGYKCIAVPSSKIYHEVNKSSGGSTSALARYYIARNNILVARQYFPNFYTFVVLNFYNQLAQSHKGKDTLKLVIATLKGEIDGLRLSTNFPLP